MKKVKVLALIMVFALAALGGAYAALWSDTITFSTNVATGNVDIKWGDAGTYDAGDDYHAGSPLDLKDGEDSVAAVTASGAVNPNANDSPQAPGMRRNVGHIAVNSSSTENDLIVDITNAYPDYQGEVEAYIVNAGSVPVILNKITAANANGGAIPAWLSYNITTIDEDQTYEEAQAVQTNPVVGTILEASNPDGSAHDTKDPDANWGTIDNKVKVKISIHVAGGTGMDVPENATASLKLNIDGTQWNGVNAHVAPVDNELPTIDLPNGIVNRFD